MTDEKFKEQMAYVQKAREIAEKIKDLPPISDESASELRRIVQESKATIEKARNTLYG